jgi:alginate O-acetyltransferase complex protein AlgI
MFSWSMYWFACMFTGIVGATAKSQAANSIYQITLLIVSVGLISVGLKVAPVPLMILFGFALIAVALIRMQLSVMWILIPVMLLWAVAKCIGFVLVPVLSLAGFVGISYFVVKLLTFLRDFQSGLVKNPKHITVMNYLFFAPTFLAGPMHYYREFDKSVKDPKLPSPNQIIPLVFRILWGATKTMVLSPLLTPHGMPVPDGLSASGSELLIRAFIFTFQLYFEFSGYSDMAIGSSKLMGIQTPENFNNPLISRNIVEFWQRWHISLMRVITGYVYVPLARKFATVKGAGPKLSMAVVTVAAFTVSGFWHGATVNFILWGIYNALIIVAYEMCRPYLVGINKLKIFAGPLMQWVFRICSICTTFFFISLGWILFNMDSASLWQFIGL